MPCARNSAPPIFFASASKISMKVVPIVLRLASGSATPVERIEEALATRRRGRAGCCSGRGTGRRPPRLRPAASSRDRRTRRSADRRSPRGCSTAATALSTPPESPQMTRPLPTCFRILAIISRRKAAIVQSDLQARDLVHEVARCSLAPSGVCTTSGWNCTA